jgi:predicted ATPase/DNA-binding CsgD family transcriptional regulator
MAATPSKAVRRRSCRLPVELTSFVGRRHEVAEVRRLLSGARAVTLTGVGGVGKTRLALRVAGELRRAFADDVWLVELAGLDDPQVVAQTVAQVMEIRDFSALPSVDVLIERLRDRNVLIVLDNCEHLLHGCAEVVQALLRSAPGVRVLATSRQPLGVSGEQTMSVPPLSIVDASESCSEPDAVRLFIERARAILPEFTLTEADREAVVRICRRLDCLPLAIELAAVRLRALSVGQLLDRLDDRFRVLTAGPSVALPRQRTLRALIDWSYGLCTESERLLWQRASVFVAGLDLEAAEEVCSGEGIAREEVLDLVAGLVEKSVLVREEHPGGVRYRMLDTIRQYGRERLVASGQEQAIQRRHRDHYRDVAARAAEELFRSAQVAWYARLRREHADLRAALEYCYNVPGEARTGLSMATDLLYHWITAYHVRDGSRLLGLGLAADPEPTGIRARALLAVSWLAVLRSDIDAARAALAESRAIAERLGLEPVLAYVALYTGMVRMRLGDVDTAIGLFHEAADRHRATGDPVGLALALYRLCLAHCVRGDARRAVTLGEESLAVCEAYDLGWHRASTMMALGVAVWQAGDARRAAELETESLRFNLALDHPFAAGFNVEVLAWIAGGEGDHERAATLLSIARTIWQAGGSLPEYGDHLAPNRHDECESQARRALGEGAFQAAVAYGARLTLEEAVAHVLQEEQPGTGPAERNGDNGNGRFAPLTCRESEIARHVARGMSNKDIAAALLIAPRTVEGHVERILHKLGFTSRAQIATWLGERVRGDGGHRGSPEPRS